MKIKPIVINVDFDGTVVTHEFPKIGKDIGAVPVLRELVEHGHKLILFTMRSNKRGNTGTSDEVQEILEDDFLDHAVILKAGRRISRFFVALRMTIIQSARIRVLGFI